MRSAIDAKGATSAEIDSKVREAVASGKRLYVIDAAALAIAAPDVILTQALCDVCALDYDAVVQAAHSLPHPPKVISLNPHSLGDVIDDIARIGKATRREREAKALMGRLRGRIAAVSRRAPQGGFAAASRVHRMVRSFVRRRTLGAGNDRAGGRP